ncbi:peptide-methionine (R)-S-oxide reductase MsrB [Pseudomonas sp. UL073]|uniref:peptide-methionine (R)-S-oxide reductase n=1 Tax=Zestomonas insulae TaxID=2809017 RepID=A0ABS2IAQ4_9GAMM|nr:peptide-methionine (R)-S-oxide reductase MsrB [Pseudomonas insulae]MBM7060199.1 peptide-methionine (R)-S-oxide reductase MsrB [Pseudomonas insulae]
MLYSRRSLLYTAGSALLAAGLFASWPRQRGFGPAPASAAPQFAVSHSDAEWRQLLTTAQYDVLRQEGTEPPHSSPLNDEHREGTFACAGCDQPLFASATKFDSGTGWPSFYQPLPSAVGETRDSSFGMLRTAVHCSRCGGHLGHVFDDGPPPTGLRYCMNGVAMTFRPASA